MLRGFHEPFAPEMHVQFGRLLERFQRLRLDFMEFRRWVYMGRMTIQ